MRVPNKALVVGLISSVTIALGTAAPAAAAEAPLDFASPAAIQPEASSTSQTLSTVAGTIEAPLDSVVAIDKLANIPHGYDVDAAIALAESEVGTSRPTGWSAPGECIMSAQRWVRAGGGNWGSGGNPVTNYDNATRVTLAAAEPGDVIQYESIDSPTSWVTGVHTVFITEVNTDGTFTIIQSNSPGGSGLVTKVENWTPEPPTGFQAAVWRF